MEWEEFRWVFPTALEVLSHLETVGREQERRAGVRASAVP
jgi:hypothetical protein